MNICLSIKKKKIQFGRDSDLQLSKNECFKQEEWRHMSFGTAVTKMEGIRIFVLCGFIH